MKIINKSLFKVTASSSWLIGLIIFLVMIMYLGIIISMFDPDDVEAIKAMVEMLPEELAAAMGFAEIGATLTSFIASYFYNFLAIMFPIIYCISVAYRLVGKHVDRGSMAYLLATPSSRRKIILTQALYLLISLTVLFLLIFLAGFLFSRLLFPGQLEVGNFLLLNLSTLVIFYAVSGICFFFSCLFNNGSYSLAFGTAVPVAFFVLRMLANLGDNFAWLGYFSLFSLIDPMEVARGNLALGTGIILPLIIALFMYGAAVIVFERRSLPL